MFRKLSALIASAALLLSSVSCGNKSTGDIKADAGSLTVTFLDVGKADCMVICTENGTAVIDCGEKGDGKKLVKLLEEQGIDTVDHLIITHYDKDHVGGAAKLIKNMDVKDVMAPDYTEESSETEKYNKALNDKGITPQLLHEDITFTMDNAEFTVYAPKKDFYGEDNDNDFSLITRIVHGNNTLLFTGDAMEQRLDEIMDIGPCTFLKVPYHGRKLDNLPDFLDAVKPKCAVVCTSSNEFASSTQKALKDRKISFYSTCFNGQIELESDGNEIKITKEKG
ncbi:MAG TPA: MBL fold metallo-hydrolase [Ruminococcus flavefaciens]|nr:MBL fold metallo-hydrolase [Ruminococcus flavefaciens]